MTKQACKYNAENRPVKFTSEDGSTVVENAYDYMGRRATKKVTVNGEVTSHLRFIYRGYLQLAAINVLNGHHLWLMLWDPSDSEATRPLAIRKDATWYCYGWDVTKNICEVFGQHGYIRASYDYAPFGEVSEAGDVTQCFQWSSEYADTELGLVYYNFRHYNAHDGRWINRDPMGEDGGYNLYVFAGNNGILMFDEIGLLTLTVEIFRYEQREEAIYSSVTVNSDDDKVNECCCLPQFYCGVERGVKKTENLLNTGILNSSLTPENSPPFGVKNPKGEGLTSIKGRADKHKSHGIQIPSRPQWMDVSDYTHAINDEFRTGDRGDNIHAGANYYHSAGCVVIGISPSGENSYQNSLEQDMRFKAAVACAKRLHPGIRIQTKVNKLPALSRETSPVIPNALEVNEKCNERG